MTPAECVSQVESFNWLEILASSRLEEESEGSGICQESVAGDAYNTIYPFRARCC